MAKRLTRKQQDKQLDEIRQLFEDAYCAYEERRRDREMENAAFYRGYHYISRDDGVQTQMIEDEAVEVQNVVRSVVRASVATRLRQFPQISISSMRGDVKARARAKASEGLCQSALHNGMIDWEEIERTASWAAQCGLGFLKVIWDPRKGKQIPTEDPGQLFIDEAADAERDDVVMEKDPFGETVDHAQFEGDVTTMFVSSADGLPNPDARSWREVRHFFHVKLTPVSEILDMFPKDMNGEELTPGDLDTGNTMGGVQAEQRYIQQDEAGLGVSSSAMDNELAQLVEFWELPSRKYKNGRFAIFSGERLIWVGPNWLEPRRLPFVPFFGDCKIPASLYPDGVLEDLKSPQRSLNRTATKMREHLDKVINAHLLVPYQSNINVNTWGDKPGQIIRYQAGYKPEFVDTPQIPNSTFEYTAGLRDVMKEISGYSDVVRGTGIDGNVSGRAAAFARENEQLTREPEMISHRNSMTSVLQHILFLVKQFFDEGRMVRILGENDHFESVEFFAEDFDLDNELVMDVYNGAPTSPAMIMSETLELLERGAFADTPDAERARAIIGNGYSRAVTYDPWADDRARARREELITARQWPVKIDVAPYDNDQVHLESHNSFRKTVEYDNLAPMQKQMFDMHCSMHEEKEMLSQVDYGQQQQWIAGNGGGNSPPQTQPPGSETGFAGPRSPMDGGNNQAPDQAQSTQPWGGDPGGAQAQDQGASTLQPMQG